MALNIGFLGTGWIASTYAKALAAMPQTRIAALCNRRLDKAEAFNANYAGGLAKCFDDFDAMLREVKLDALFVCLPPGSHNGQAEAAAARGIHLMLEKPIALSMERAESIARAVTAAGVRCQIGHHMRHTRPAIKLKRMLTDGTAGRPLFMQGSFFVNALFPMWWRNPLTGGGQLIEQAIHLYDLSRYFLGAPTTITAFAGKLSHARFPDYQVDDVSASTIHFGNDAIASLSATNVADPEQGQISFTVMCENVMATFKSPDEATFVYHQGKTSEEIAGTKLDRETVTSQTNAYEELTADFVRAITDGTPARSGIVDGVESLRLVLSAARSARNNGMPESITTTASAIFAK